MIQLILRESDCRIEPNGTGLLERFGSIGLEVLTLLETLGKRANELYEIISLAIVVALAVTAARHSCRLAGLARVQIEPSSCFGSSSS